MYMQDNLLKPSAQYLRIKKAKLPRAFKGAGVCSLAKSRLKKRFGAT